jgi:hypothetical protein
MLMTEEVSLRNSGPQASEESRPLLVRNLIQQCAQKSVIRTLELYGRRVLSNRAWAVIKGVVVRASQIEDRWKAWTACGHLVANSWRDSFVIENLSRHSDCILQVHVLLILWRQAIARHR